MTGAPVRIAVVDPASWSLAYDIPLAEALARQGFDVTVHCARSPHVGLPVAATPEVRVVESFYRSRVPAPRRVTRALQHPFDLTRLARSLRQDADVVIVQWLPERHLDARVWHSLARHVPVVFVAHNAQERENTLGTNLMQGFTAVVAHSASGAAALRARGLPIVWQLAIGAYDQYAAMATPDPLPLEVSPTTPLAVFVGLLRRYKGIDVLLAAWPEVLRRVPDARLVVAGRPMDVSLPEAPGHGVTVLPRFLTEQELGWLLRRADVCALPYRAIDMSGIAASALACSTPVVATDVGGMGELAGRGALIVPSEDAGALAAALVRVLGDTQVRDDLRAQARQAVRTYYSWDAIAVQWRDRLTSLIEAHQAL